MPILSRPYASEDDYARMRELLQQIYRQTSDPVYCTLGDLDWWRSSDDDPESVRHARLWFDEQERLVGFAWPSDDQVDLLVQPTHAGLEDQMLEWAEQRRGAAQEPEQPLRLLAWAYSGDLQRQALLERRGYRRAERRLVYFTRDLLQLPAEPHLPPGYQLRHLAGQAELEQRAAVHRDAFGSRHMTAAKYHRVMQMPTYRPELDLVVVAPDGSFAAFGLVWYDEQNQHGVFEPVGCHPAHQRRGLGRAIMDRGLRRLAALGARSAAVNAAGSSIPAQRLYAAAGFSRLAENQSWQKLL